MIELDEACHRLANNEEAMKLLKDVTDNFVLEAERNMLDNGYSEKGYEQYKHDAFRRDILRDYIGFIVNKANEYKTKEQE